MAVELLKQVRKAVRRKTTDIKPITQIVRGEESTSQEQGEEVNAYEMEVKRVKQKTVSYGTLREEEGTVFLSF